MDSKVDFKKWEKAIKELKYSVADLCSNHRLFSDIGPNAAPAILLYCALDMTALLVNFKEQGANIPAMQELWEMLSAQAQKYLKEMIDEK